MAHLGQLLTPQVGRHGFLLRVQHKLLSGPTYTLGCPTHSVLQHADMILMHLGKAFDEGSSHILLYFKHSIEEFTAWKVFSNEGCDFKTVECRANVIEMLINFVIVVVECVELGKVPQFQAAQVYLSRLYREVVEVTFVRQSCEPDFIQTMWVWFNKCVHRCGSMWVSEELEYLR